MASLKPNMSSMILSYSSQVFLRLIVRDEEGVLFFSPLTRNHDFLKILNRFNWDSDACSFVESVIIYPDVLRVPVSFLIQSANPNLHWVHRERSRELVRKATNLQQGTNSIYTIKAGAEASERECGRCHKPGASFED